MIPKVRIICLALSGIFLTLAIAAQNRLVVASDGSGDYHTIGEALEACRAFQDTETVIFIRNGICREKLHVDSFLTHIRLLGESAENTIISYNDYASLNDMGTFRTYTLKITGSDITLENLTVENTAGNVGQAVALHVEGDHFKAINCRNPGPGADTSGRVGWSHVLTDEEAATYTAENIYHFCSSWKP